VDLTVAGHPVDVVSEVHLADIYQPLLGN